MTDTPRNRVAAGVLLGAVWIVAGCSASSAPRTSSAPASSGSAARVRATSAVATVVSAPASSAVTPAASTGLAGSWVGTYQSAKYPTTTSGTFRATFAVSGGTITGTVSIASNCVSTGTVSGRLEGSRITFGAVKAAESVTFSGTIARAAMSGTYSSGPACGDDRGTWKAVRG